MEPATAEMTIAMVDELGGTIEVIEQADNGADAVRATLQHRPDVLVIDLEMPKMGGLEATTAILAERPEQRVLVLTRHARPGALRRALRAGVRGFMSKSADAEEIAAVIRKLHSGQRWIAHDVLEASMADDSPPHGTRGGRAARDA